MSGSLEIDGQYCIFRLEESLPAILEGCLIQDRKSQLFDRWLEDRFQSMKIQLNLKTEQVETVQAVATQKIQCKRVNFKTSP